MLVSILIFMIGFVAGVVVAAVIVAAIIITAEPRRPNQKVR